MPRDSILILENDDANRKKLVEIFQDKYKILEISTEKEGIEVLRKHAASLAVVLFNLMIPAKNNFQVLQMLSEKKFLTRIPFIMITDDKTAEYEKKG